MLRRDLFRATAGLPLALVVQDWQRATKPLPEPLIRDIVDKLLTLGLIAEVEEDEAIKRLNEPLGPLSVLSNVLDHYVAPMRSKGCAIEEMEN